MEIKTYKQHYEKARLTEANLYDHIFVMNPFEIDQNNLGSLSKQCKKMFDSKSGCIEDQWSLKLDGVKYIPQLERICKQLAVQVEERFFGSYCKVEFIHCYRNKTNATNESSWAWHYDDCPREFMKIGLYLNYTTENNGCMQIITSEEGPREIESFRTWPDAPKGNPPPIYPKSRIPNSEINRFLSEKYYIKNIVGPMGTNFFFTPNIPHRATIPEQDTEPREAIIFFVRPSLKKIQNYSTEASYYTPARNVKRYNLD
jgi:hypothetical protein